MPIDPQEGIDDWFVPADPSQWQSRGLPRIIVHPKPPPTGPSDNPAGADGIDDWFVPGQTPSGANGLDDWYVPTNASTDTPYPDDWYVPTPPAPAAPRSTANPGISNPATTRPDPFEAYWSLIPASRIGAMAWHPPIFPNSAGQFPLAAPAPLSVPGVAKQGLLGALADLPATSRADSYGLLGALANLPATDAPSYGLLGALANLPSLKPAPSPFSQPTGLPSGYGDEFAPPSFSLSSPNGPLSPPPTVPGGAPDTNNAGGGQFTFLDSVRFIGQLLNGWSGFTPATLNSPLASAFLPPAASGKNGGANHLFTPVSDIDSLPALPALDLPGEPPGPDPVVASGSSADLLASTPTPGMDNARLVELADQPATNGSPSAGSAVAVAPPIDQTSVGNEGSAQPPAGDRQLDTIDQSDQASNLETGLTPSQIQALAELYRDALASVASYVRANDQLARVPIDLADMAHDAVTDFPEFLRRAEPGLAGLGLSIPMTRAAGNVWLLNDTLRGRIAEMVHGANLPFTFKTIDRFLDGIATSIKSIDLNAPSYQNVQKLYSTLRNQIDKVADFTGGRRSGVVIKPHEINGRALDVLVPHSGSAAQKVAIKRAVDYGAQQGVTVNIIRHQ